MKCNFKDLSLSGLKIGDRIPRSYPTLLKSTKFNLHDFSVVELTKSGRTPAISSPMDDTLEVVVDKWLADSFRDNVTSTQKFSSIFLLKHNCGFIFIFEQNAKCHASITCT